MKALIIVDVQNDFLPGGALAVKEGDQIIPLINRLQSKFDLIVATQDWHPKDHGSFAGNHNKNPGEKIQLAGLEQILWPDHCVQETPGADFAADLKVEKIDKVFCKGTNKNIDSYSGFFDNGHKKSTGLGDYLKEKGVTEVYIVGLATDYCVKFTALDAVRLGYKTYLIVDACKGVNLKIGDVTHAIEGMQKAGVVIVKTDIFM
jgi:nicotinamidase/pyrazinamidase